eukprot:6461061-Amphidinium_carterae.1
MEGSSASLAQTSAYKEDISCKLFWTLLQDLPGQLRAWSPAILATNADDDHGQRMILHQLVRSAEKLQMEIVLQRPDQRRPVCGCATEGVLRKLSDKAFELHCRPHWLNALKSISGLQPNLPRVLFQRTKSSWMPLCFCSTRPDGLYKILCCLNHRMPNPLLCSLKSAAAILTLPFESHPKNGSPKRPHCQNRTTLLSLP